MSAKKTMEEVVETLATRVEGLAVEMKQGFKSMDTKFVAMDKKFESRFDSVDVKFVAMDKKFDGVEAKFVAMDKKFESRFDGVDAKFVAMDKSVDNKIEKLAMAVNEGFSSMSKEFREEFREVKERLDHVEFNTSGQERRISTLEDKVRMIGTKLKLDLRGA